MREECRELVETLRLANSWQFAPGFVKAMLGAADIIEQLAEKCDQLEWERNAEPAAGWISVKDRMPTYEECGDFVLVVVNGKLGSNTYEDAICLCWLTEDGDEWTEYGTGNDLTGMVSHWVPLPDPPEQEPEWKQKMMQTFLGGR
ncbi:MAG: DUF551 domain-containing protein [Oscillospiraceae bacterium]|nr:DUF551 domain-containing protein [Oscillospiraceae bacterium]